MIRVAQGAEHKDARGTIRDLLIADLDGATIITTKAGAIRGNHYHQDTTQWTYVLDGSIKVVTEMLPEPPLHDTLQTGEMMVSPPMERHAWQAIEDSIVLVLTKGPRSGEDYESDVVRLEGESRLIA